MSKNQFTDNNVAHLDAPNACGVYLLTDTTTQKTYVGSALRIRTRITLHFFEMKRSPNARAYRNFAATYAQYGPKVFSVAVLELCSPEERWRKERGWVEKVQPTENSYLCADGRPVYSEGITANKSAAAARLWENPEYRERAIAARKGKAYNKGYKCTPAQVENRKRNARISHAKRMFGVDWVAAYRARYPEHALDVAGVD